MTTSRSDVVIPQHPDWIYILVRTPQGDWIKIKRVPKDTV